MTRLGTSRTSSVFGLKASPQMATLEDGRVHPVLGHGADQGFHVLGEARATIAHAGEEEARADPGVRADAPSYRIDFGARGLAQASDGVHELIRVASMA